jgi:hypothetical protein
MLSRLNGHFSDYPTTQASGLKVRNAPAAVRLTRDGYRLARGLGRTRMCFH